MDEELLEYAKNLANRLESKTSRYEDSGFKHLVLEKEVKLIWHSIVTSRPHKSGRYLCTLVDDYKDVYVDIVYCDVESCMWSTEYGIIYWAELPEPCEM